MDKAILETFKDYLSQQLNIKHVLLEPQPAKLQEPHLRIMPVGWAFRFEDKDAHAENNVFSVKLEILLTLTAQGDGPDVFLDYVLDASFKVNRLLERPFNVIFGETFFSVAGERRPGGQFFQNEDKGEGQKPYLYEESFNVSLFFPYKETIDE